MLFENEEIDQEKINMIENSIDYVGKSIMDQMAYLSDLQIELQNKLLIKLFENKVLKRKPNNPNLKVISTDIDQLENLKKYFDEKDRLRENKKKV